MIIKLLFIIFISATSVIAAESVIVGKAYTFLIYLSSLVRQRIFAVPSIVWDGFSDLRERYSN